MNNILKAYNYYLLLGYIDIKVQEVLSLLDAGKLGSSNKYQTLSPCFRQDKIDVIHQTEFLKLELIEFGDNYNECKMKVDNMIKNVIILFNEILGDNISILLTNDKRSLFSSNIVYNFNDIFANEKSIVLGSYGIRKCNEYYYVYGTGFDSSRMDTVAMIV